jgi:hypothetical protein
MLSSIRTAILSAILALPFTLMAQKEFNGTIEVKSISSVIKLDGHQVFYSLPMNTIAVKFKITKTEMFRGPYAEFAAKLLNISSGVIMADGTDFTLDSVSMVRYSIADTVAGMLSNTLAGKIYPLYN